MLTAQTAASFHLGGVDASFAQDPYPDFRMLRDHAPACRQPDGSLVITRYEDVRRVLTDAAAFSSDKKVDFKPKFGDSPLYEHHTTSLVFNDPPAHTRVRKLLGPFFAVQTLKQLQARISTMVDELLDRAQERGRIDVMQEFALPIPLNLVGDLLGVPRSERVMIMSAANDALPASAIIAGQLNACVEGRSAIMTPMKPTRIALQRRQPTFSPRKSAEAAVTKIGAAR